ncbi:MAG: hypothetical protein V3V02_05245 [Rhizobiaceae bacterium]
MIFKVIGGILVAWGIADIGGSWMDIDVWQDWLGISLSGIFYQFSGWASLLGGGMIWGLGSSDDDDEEETGGES